MEVLVFGSIIWIPILVWRERVRSKEFGFLPGFVVRLAVVALVVCVALILPLKHEDTHRVGPLTKNMMSLSEISNEIHIANSYPPTAAATTIELPSTTPTIREVLRAMEKATGLSARAARCGNSATLV